MLLCPHAIASVHCCIVVTCWERADLLALVGDVYCVFFWFFPMWYPGSVWYLIVSFPDLCCLSYFNPCNLMDFPLHIDTVSMVLPICILKGHSFFIMMHFCS